MVTDYDCWHESEESVTADLVARTMRKNVEATRGLLTSALNQTDPEADCLCRGSLSGAVVTDPA